MLETIGIMLLMIGGDSLSAMALNEKRKTKKVLFRIEVRVLILFCTRVRMSPLEPLSSWVTCLVRISCFCLLSGSRFIPKYPVSWKFEEFMSKVYSFRYD
jgi:hypothetical protein